MNCAMFMFMNQKLVAVLGVYCMCNLGAKILVSLITHGMAKLLAWQTTKLQENGFEMPLVGAVGDCSTPK